MLFSLGIAIFHTVILSTLYDLKFPTWLFFVLNPTLIGISALIYKPIAGIVFIILFLSLFLLAFVGIFFSGIKGIIKKNQSQKNKKPFWKILIGIVLTILSIIGFILFQFNFIIIVVAIIILYRIIFTKSRIRFLQLQSVLPTSAIRSMAMGLVEVKGTIEHIEYLISPLKSKQCIGYRYTVEKISTDSDNEKSYSTIKDVTVCNDFYIKDDTGQVKVRGEELELLWIEKDQQYSSGEKRYTQYLLHEKDNVLLIGKASSDDKEVFIEKEPIKKIFMLAPATSVDKWNKYKPLLNSLIIALVLLAILTIFILWADITVDGNSVHVILKKISFR